MKDGKKERKRKRKREKERKKEKERLCLLVWSIGPGSIFFCVFQWSRHTRQPIERISNCICTYKCRMGVSGKNWTECECMMIPPHLGIMWHALAHITASIKFNWLWGGIKWTSNEIKTATASKKQSTISHKYKWKNNQRYRENTNEKIINDVV